MIKKFLFLACCFSINCPALAGGWGQLYGKNSLGQMISITDDTRSGNAGILVSDQHKSAEYPLRGACSFNLEGLPPEQFSCTSKGASPVAGAAYKKSGRTGACLAMRFKCVSGCSKYVPAVLVYQPWEC